ncbi:MAG: hypothetical protein UDO37_09500 [Oscillospiraceae bacterium]|nr:hypothetical protein [Oscillospiraceae bacterium]
MYGYIRQGQRTALTREVIGGVPFWVLTTGRGWQRLRVRSMLRRLARHGVRTAVFEDDTWQTAAARYGIHPVPVGALRLAKLEELLDCVCPALSGKTVRLAVGENGGTARQAAQVLAKRARYIELTPPGQTALAQWLLARYGVAAGSGGQQAAAVVWCGTADSVSEGPAIYLGADCAARQEVRYEAAGLAPWPVSEQLLAALLAADGWEASEIHVVSVVSRA